MSEGMDELKDRIAALEAERDAALADNAALMMFATPLAEVACEGVGPEECGECVSCMAKLHVVQTHPGAGLLEKHRKALVHARNEGLERAAAKTEERGQHWCDPYTRCTCDWAERIDGMPDAIRALKEDES